MNNTITIDRDDAAFIIGQYSRNTLISDDTIEFALDFMEETGNTDILHIKDCIKDELLEDWVESRNLESELDSYLRECNKNKIDDLSSAEKIDFVKNLTNLNQEDYLGVIEENGKIYVAFLEGY